MKLKLQVLNHPDCTPVEGALVDIWHCDADGNYSGYPEEISRDVWKSFVLLTKHAKELPSGQIHVEPLTDTRYLRGMQRTNAEGWVEFQTIFPGWYEGRVPHVHVKVILNPDEEVITQLYFDREMQDRIYTTLAPYDKHGKSPLTIYDDSVVAGTGKNQLDGLMLKPQWSGDAPLQAVGKIGISTA